MVPSSSSMWCSMFLQHRELRAPRLIVRCDFVQLLDDEVGDVMLLEALEDNLARLW